MEAGEITTLLKAGWIGLATLFAWGFLRGLRELWGVLKTVAFKMLDRFEKSMDLLDGSMRGIGQQFEDTKQQMLAEIMKKHAEHEVSDEQRHTRLVELILDQAANGRHSVANQLQVSEYRITSSLFTRAFKATTCSTCSTPMFVRMDHEGLAECAGCKQLHMDAERRNSRAAAIEDSKTA